MFNVCLGHIRFSIIFFCLPRISWFFVCLRICGVENETHLGFSKAPEDKKKNRHKWKIAHTIYVMKTDEKFTFCSQWIDVDSNAAALTHWTQKPTRKQWREWTGHYGETQRDKGGGVGFIKLHVMTQLRCRVKMFIREYSVILHIWAWCRCNHMQWVEVIATMIVRTSF